jgi:uncharacterized protein YggT (Ycf19 family)
VATLTLIAVRALCLGFAAATQSGAADAIVKISAPLVAPFQSVLPDGGTSTNSIEFASLLAVVVYSFIGLGLAQLYRVLATPRGIKPVTMKDAKSPFDRGLAVLAMLSYFATTFAVVQHYTPIGTGPSSLTSSSVGGTSDGGSGGTGGGTSGGGGGGGSGGYITAPTPVSTPHSSCAVSVVGSQNGVSWYQRVNATSTAPCYSHWTFGIAGGTNCGFWVNGARYSAPANIWNITGWGQDSSHVYATLYDGNFVILSCVINLGNYPQTSLYPSDFR